MTREELREWRQRHGLTLEQLAKEVGVETNTIWRWEKGDRQPNKFTAPLLERAIRRLEKRQGEPSAA